MSDGQFAAVFAAILGGFFFVIGIGISATDAHDWVTQDDCVTHVHDDNRIGWAPDTETVTTYCKRKGGN